MRCFQHFSNNIMATDPILMTHTIWTVDFETPVCKLYLLFISADAAQEQEKKEKKVLLPTGVYLIHILQSRTIVSEKILGFVPFL
jgi:hypothetical protein